LRKDENILSEDSDSNDSMEIEPKQTLVRDAAEKVEEENIL